MSEISLQQLDARIKASKTNLLIAYNQLSENADMTRRTRLRSIMMLVFNGLLVLIGTALDFNHMLSDYIQIALSGICLIVMIWAYFQNTRRAMMSIASISTAFGIYNLIGAYFIEGQIDFSNIVIGVVQILSAMYYISRANSYQQNLLSIGDNLDHTLYDDVRTVLDAQRPNNSNNLIELQEFTQTITVWLRQDGAVLLLKRENRLYFDVHHSFKLIADGNDRGGDKLTVKATIINQARRCLISRHGWLRYTRFAT